MGTITPSIGLISGIDTASLIDSLIALESRSKVRLQQRIAVLQNQRSALLDINARLLNFKSISESFRASNIFKSMLASSSNPDVLTATATLAAQPGSYNFTVKQLVAASQKLSKGFSDTDTTPLGLSSLSFEFGRGRLNRDRALSELNGGAGVAQGKITITDRSGSQATIDLTDAVTVGEVLERINGADGIAVTAGVDGDHFVLTDTSGGSGTFSVANVTGFTTATDLGIAGSAAGDTLTGSAINTVGLSTSLSSLNDGNGVLLRDNVSDLQVRARNGTMFNIDLGRLNLDITADTALSELNNGNGVTISDDHDNPDIRFIARDGTEYDVNLTGVSTVGELISRVNSETAGHVQLSIGTGDRLIVTDTVGGSGNLQIEGAGANGTETAEDLGILNEAGVAQDSYTGAPIPNTIGEPPVSTIEQLIARVEAQTDGAISIAVASDGHSLQLIDNVGGAQNLIVSATPGNPDAAAQLGLLTDPAGVAADQVDGSRLLAGLNSVLVGNLNGGAGLNGATSLSFTDRAGNNVAVTGLASYDSLDELIAGINLQAASAGVDITVALNASGTGLRVQDNSGSTVGNLVISGDAATALGIEADVAADSVSGSNLQHQYVDTSTRLSDLNFGRGVAVGSFRITDGFGGSEIVNVQSIHTTLYDVIQAINSRDLAVRARINDTGDGLIIEEDLTGVPPGANPFRTIKIEGVSGSTAKDLNILGESETILDGAAIDGSYEFNIALNESDNLSQIVQKINAAGAPVSASILNTGNGATPYRLSLISGIAGLDGDLVIDSGAVDLGLTTLTKAQDAKVFFGSPGSDSGFLVTSSTNTVKNVVEGVTLDLIAASNDPVTVTVSRDTDKIVKTVADFVQAFNDTIRRIDEYDFYDVESEERGILLGNPTTSRIRAALFRTLNAPAEGVESQFRFLRDVGIRVGAEGNVTFDEEKFREAYESDPNAVRDLFAAFESTPAQPQQIAPGVTVEAGSDMITRQGVAEMFAGLLDGLTDSSNGSVTLAEQNFQSQIDLAKERVEAFDIRLEARRAQLERQFAAMELALAQLQSQGNALVGLQSNVQLASNLGGKGPK